MPDDWRLDLGGALSARRRDGTLPTHMNSVLTAREYAYVAIAGPGTHDVVTSALQLQPSEAWNAGEPSPRNGKPRRSMLWQLASGLDDTRSMREHIDALFDVLGTRANELRTLWLDYDLTLQCVGHYPSWTHGIHFDRDVVRKAANLGLAIDLDCYVVEEDDSDTTRA